MHSKTLVFQIRTLEDQIEISKSGFKNTKTEEMSLKRLVTVKREKLAAVEIKLKKIYENTELQKQAITEYEYWHLVCYLTLLILSAPLMQCKISNLKKTH